MGVRLISGNIINYLLLPCLVKKLNIFDIVVNKILKYNPCGSSIPQSKKKKQMDNNENYLNLLA